MTDWIDWVPFTLCFWSRDTNSTYSIHYSYATSLCYCYCFCSFQCLWCQLIQLTKCIELRFDWENYRLRPLLIPPQACGSSSRSTGCWYKPWTPAILFLLCFIIIVFFFLLLLLLQPFACRRLVPASLIPRTHLWLLWVLLVHFVHPEAAMCVSSKIINTHTLGLLFKFTITLTCRQQLHLIHLLEAICAIGYWWNF